MVARGWSEAQKRAYVIADNKLALNAGWDVELLKVELTDLKAMGADLGLVGFADDELAELFADRSAGLTDPDDVPEPLPEPVRVLGRCVAARPASAGLRRQHRSGDGRASAQLARAQLMVTDPPYGVDYDPAWRTEPASTESRRSWARWRTTIGPTGARPGRCSRAASPMSGMRLDPQCRGDRLARSVRLSIRRRRSSGQGPVRARTRRLPLAA